ncbi:LuxR C-terminal-related transcriptional regulator [Kineococcus sp. SYSU DK005]|uniref:LuxR C-terminal-related transcriptional regulator n=1 Tax=Kineococcus sp. SYSU DK005 TaxID=3383126 RepID=UPI003D7DEE91
MIATATGEEALRAITMQAPSLVLLSAHLPDLSAPEAVQALLARQPHLVLLVSADLSTPAARRDVEQAVRAGARGYLDHDACAHEVSAVLAHALRTAGSSSHPARPARPAAAPHALQALKEREQQVLHGISEGLSNLQIGQQLYLAEDTVKSHAKVLFRKLGVHDRAHAGAHRHGLLHGHIAAAGAVPAGAVPAGAVPAGAVPRQRASR